jgi:hypothetical protein
VGTLISAASIAGTLSEYHCLHPRVKLLPDGLCFSGGELVVRQSELLAAHYPSPSL